jgi:L-rhamnose mutarotase
MKRYCLVLELNEEFVDDYCDIHRTAWPELLKAIKENGAKELLLWNYKNFSIVYYEVEDIDALYEKLNKLEVTKKWNAIMDKFFKESLPVDSEGKFITCDKIFDLNQQLEGKLEKY